ncbi:hypothetical protein GCM10025864_40020 [Luteimicrobium album]|uniref:Uncharacterized protein n=1 Tax=Luteimicrobium album TaxID=1054550 RepID=A0ABQ6I8F2_9MICO|nr:iron chelate uptake ABC transporter family permease subunit [Luteimicrobium album]GMA26243.1 hypothetical protein GCM10025864_40020 [Luteimicrobium album]
MRSRAWVIGVAVVLVVALVAAFVVALLLGDRVVLLGDVTNWWRGVAGDEVTFVLQQRWPRVLAALLGGGALALAGAIVQAVCRNPLAEPSLLGVTPGASVGAVAVVLLVPGVGIWPVMGAATLAALATFALVYRLAAGRRSGKGGGAGCRPTGSSSSASGSAPPRARSPRSSCSGRRRGTRASP